VKAKDIRRKVKAPGKTAWGRPLKEHVELLAAVVLFDLLVDYGFTSQERDLRGLAGVGERNSTSGFCTQCFLVTLANGTF